jgi:hypothetical protein
MISENNIVRNRGFIAAGVGVAMFIVGAAIAGESIMED